MVTITSPPFPPPVVLHSLPCSIACPPSSRASVAAYFKPAPMPPSHPHYKRAEGLRVAQLRGRALCGRTCPVPSGTVGLVLGPSTAGDDGGGELRVEGGFGGFEAWGHDYAPPEGGGAGRVLEEWVEMARAIHDE
ncbi:hypothetical protein TeGR_g11009 [Tetraparma gracilis]|uniref:Uncharacterized protein n=1 Tax=Tetraparma gracilis TaxID=2962635 RepID=A0ABQ6MWJ4_9STRA|nr:hypothetical protein TeGR_g11009 [Tetraparma gracilis]